MCYVLYIYYTYLRILFLFILFHHVIDKYVITPAEHSLSNQYNIKKLWIIVKDLPEKYYALHENDIIKLGRFRLKVRQFIESVDTLNTLKLDDCPSKKM